jgi:hypothetical protein
VSAAALNAYGGTDSSMGLGRDLQGTQDKMAVWGPCFVSANDVFFPTLDYA